MDAKIMLTTINYSSQDFMPLALYNIAAYLDKNLERGNSGVKTGIKVFYDHESARWISEKILKSAPDIIGFSCYIWNIRKTLQVIRILRKAAPRLKIILGGPEVGARAGELMEAEKGVYAIVVGEGEETFLRLVEFLVYGRDEPGGISGICRRDNGAVVYTPARTPIKDLERIPSPYLEGLIDIKRFSMVLVETMRGCCYACHYCYEHKNHGPVRYFSLSRIERELRLILAAKPATVAFLDSTFNASPERAKAVLRIFIKHNKVSELTLGLKAELVDNETVELLSRARAYLNVGIQSVNRKTLKIINRTLRKNEFKKNIKLLRQKGISVNVHLIALLPGETYADLKRSLDWASSLRPSEIQMLRCLLLPGTYFWRHRSELGLKCLRTPPYIVYGNSALSARDTKKAIELVRICRLFDGNRLLMRSFYAAKRIFRIPLSRIFEEWSRWGKALTPREKKLLTKRTTNKYSCLYLVAPRFMRHLCGVFKNKSAYEAIYPALREDMFQLVALRLKTSVLSNQLKMLPKGTVPSHASFD